MNVQDVSKKVVGTGRKIFRVCISMVLIANTFTGVNTAGAQTAGETQLGVLSRFSSLSDIGLRNSLQTQAEIISGVKLLLKGKTYSAVNGLLIEKHGDTMSGGESNIEFLPEPKLLSGNNIEAEFKLNNKPGFIFSVKYFENQQKIPAEEPDRESGKILKIKDVFKERDVLILAPRFCGAVKNRDLFLRIMEKWEELMQRGGIFNYTLDEVKVRDLGRIKAMYNPGRGGKRPAQMDPSSLDQPFRSDKFNFNKIKEEEVIIEDLDIEGVSADILVNVNPFEKGHVLITPERKKEHNQYFNFKAALAGLGMLERTGRKSYKIIYNSVGAFASINHLHLQAFDYGYDGGELPVEKGFELSGKRNVISEKNDVHLFSFSDWIMPCLVLNGTNKRAIIEQLVTITSLFHEENQPYNILFTYNGPEYNVYIFPRGFETPNKFGTGVATLESSGVAIFVNQADSTPQKSREIFEKATEKEIVKEISNAGISIERFKELKDECEKNIQASSEDYYKEAGVWRKHTNSITRQSNDELVMMQRAIKYLDEVPVNMYIDISAIPLEKKEQLERNMETMTQVITGYNSSGMKIRYILDNDMNGEGVKILKKNLPEDLSVRLGKAYVPGDKIKTSDGGVLTVNENNLIDIRLENLNNIKRDRIIREREYLVALRDYPLNSGISIPNYTAASAIGLSLAALRAAKDDLEGPEHENTEYLQFRSRILDHFRNIYKRYDVINKKKDFSLTELELMVTGSSPAKMYYVILYSLPPAVKGVEWINKYHELMRDVRRSA